MVFFFYLQTVACSVWGLARWELASAWGGTASGGGGWRKPGHAPGDGTGPGGGQAALTEAWPKLQWWNAGECWNWFGETQWTAGERKARCCRELGHSICAKESERERVSAGFKVAGGLYRGGAVVCRGLGTEARRQRAGSKVLKSN